MRKKIQNILRMVVKFYFLKNLFAKIYNLIVENPPLKSNNLFEPPINIKSVVNEIDIKGFSKNFQMDEEQLLELIKDCNTHPCYPNLDSPESYKIDFSNPHNPNGEYFRYLYKSPENWTSIKNIIYNETILNVAKSYLGNNPIIQNVTVWWSFNKEEQIKSSIYNFHYDIDNLKFLKLFTYLTDVGEKHGPHVIFPSTHKRKTWLQKRNRSVTENNISRVIGKNEPSIMLGKSGTSFFEDTFSYHKGENPIFPRLIFQVEYSLTRKKLG